MTGRRQDTHSTFPYATLISHFKSSSDRGHLASVSFSKIYEMYTLAFNWSKSTEAVAFMPEKRPSDVRGRASIVSGYLMERKTSCFRSSWQPDQKSPREVTICEGATGNGCVISFDCT